MSAQVYQPYFDETNPSVESDPNQVYFSIDKTQVWLVNEPEAIFIVFRGTSYEDFLTDLKFRKEETDFGRVHRGFHDYVLKTQFQVISILYQWDPRMKKPVIMTGHSLGAAAAVIEACYLNELGFDIAGIYTFGEPRIGNSRFARFVDDAFDGKHFRHVNGLDGVPMIPPIHWGYRHCGQRFYFSTFKQRLIRNAPLCQVIMERLPILLRRPWKWSTYKIIDHAVQGYVGACQRNLETN
jgi:predicted lipase